MMGAGERSCLRRHRWKVSPLALLLVAAAVVVPLVIVKPWDKNTSKNKDHTSMVPSPQIPIDPGQLIVPSKDDTGKCNAYTPALNQPFDYASGKLKMRGVNLGGWPEAAKALLEKHYATWVTGETFIRIRGLGLNHVRIPIGFCAMGGLTADEPYVPNLSWAYLLRAIEWARKCGIRVMVELHAAPGSQNGWNHSGRSGVINWINGTEGAANAQRTLPYIQQLATFFTSPDYAHVGPILGLLNEPAGFLIGGDPVKSWYRQATDVFRTATGVGKGPWLIIHDAFLGLGSWTDLKSNDAHQYIMFDDNLLRMNRTTQLQFACQNWGSDMVGSTEDFGPTIVGEFSIAVNDCAKYLNSVGMGYRWDCTFDGAPPKSPNSTCMNENTASMNDAEYKKFLSDYFNAQVDAFEQGAGWFYWNFKTETNPLWSYFDGVDNGWIPKDANNRGSGFCVPNGYSFSKPASV